jgi:hypothetical protein
MNNLTLQVMLEGLAEALCDKVVPALSLDAYAMEQARLASVLLTLVAKQVDGLAAVRVAENAGMRALFSDAAPIIGGELSARLVAAASAAEPGFKISELDAEGRRLRLLLVELQAVLEEIDGAEARRMDKRIWCLLRDMEERRG